MASIEVDHGLKILLFGIGCAAGYWAIRFVVSAVRTYRAGAYQEALKDAKDDINLLSDSNLVKRANERLGLKSDNPDQKK